MKNDRMQVRARRSESQSRREKKKRRSTFVDAERILASCCFAIPSFVSVYLPRRQHSMLRHLVVNSLAAVLATRTLVALAQEACSPARDRLSDQTHNFDSDCNATQYCAAAGGGDPATTTTTTGTCQYRSCRKDEYPFGSVPHGCSASLRLRLIPGSNMEIGTETRHFRRCARADSTVPTGAMDADLWSL